MDLLIFIKWATNWEGRSHEAPGIINIMINMPLKLGSTVNLKTIIREYKNEKFS